MRFYAPKRLIYNIFTIYSAHRGSDCKQQNPLAAPKTPKWKTIFFVPSDPSKKINMRRFLARIENIFFLKHKTRPLQTAKAVFIRKKVFLFYVSVRYTIT